jgi:hypothetical protein
MKRMILFPPFGFVTAVLPWAQFVAKYGYLQSAGCQTKALSGWRFKHNRIAKLKADCHRI